MKITTTIYIILFVGFLIASYRAGKNSCQADITRLEKKVVESLLSVMKKAAELENKNRIKEWELENDNRKIAKAAQDELSADSHDLSVSNKRLQELINKIRDSRSGTCKNTATANGTGREN